MASESKRPAATDVTITPFVGDAPTTDLDIGAALAAGADTTVIARLTQCLADPTFCSDNRLGKRAKCRHCTKERKCGLLQVGDIFAILKGFPPAPVAEAEAEAAPAPPGHCHACGVSLKMYRIGVHPQANDSFCLWSSRGGGEDGPVCLSRDPDTLRTMRRLCRGCRECAGCCYDNPELFQVQRELSVCDPITPDIQVAATHHPTLSCIRTTEISPHPPYVELEAKGTAIYVHKMTMPLDIRRKRTRGAKSASAVTKTAEVKRALANGSCFEPGSDLHMKWQWARQQGFVVYPLPDDLKDSEMSRNALNTSADFRVSESSPGDDGNDNKGGFPYDTLFKQDTDYGVAKKPDIEADKLISRLAKPDASRLAKFQAAASVNMKGRTHSGAQKLEDEVPYAFLPRDFVVFKIPIDPRSSSQAKGCLSSWALTAADRTKPAGATNYLFTTRLLAEMEKKMPYPDFIRWALRSLRRVTPRLWLSPGTLRETDGETKKDATIAEVAHRIRLDETHRREIAERTKAARENRQAVADLLKPLQHDMLLAYEQNESLPLFDKYGLKCCMRADGKVPRKPRQKCESSPSEAFERRVNRRASVLADALVGEDLVSADVLKDPRKLALLQSKCRRLAAKCLAPEEYSLYRKAPTCLSWTVVPAVATPSTRATKKRKIWSDRTVEGAAGTREGE